MNTSLTFVQLEKSAGQNYSPAQGNKWPLEEWYDSIRNIPIDRLSAGDIAKACRQNVWIEHVVPLAIGSLKHNPQAGHLYAGELVVALKSIPTAFWARHRETAHELKTVVQRTLPQLDDGVQRDAVELLSHLG